MAADRVPPTRPASFGEELLRQRENAGISIEDIIAETKISRRILEALEAGKFQFLPERIFSRNFVRQYARAIGVEDARLVEWFDEAWERFLLTSGSHPALQAARHDPPKETIRWRYWLPIVAAIAILGAVALSVVRVGNGQSGLDPDPRRSSFTVPSPTSAAQEEHFAPMPLDAVSPTETALASQAGPVEVTVRVEAGRECWVHYRDRDGNTGEFLLAGGERLDMEVEGPAHLTLGNAAAATLRVAGHDYGTLGKPGQVLHAEVSQTGLEVLSGAGVHE